MSMIPTTTIGAFPKPDYLPIGDWFNTARNGQKMDAVKATQGYSAVAAELDENAEALFVRAAAEVIAIQLRSGITIPTDGEVRRENYIHYHCRHLHGFDFEQLEHRTMRDGAYETELPAIRAAVQHGGSGYARHDFAAAQGVCRQPLKFTLPGPLTIMDTTADCFYNDRKRLHRDLAETINQEARALADAGCRSIQIDEPLFARNVDEALDIGMEGLERCFHKVPKSVTRVVHMCCGYPNQL
ncbi:5-methyltetrahydropteroyltriglutamate--homocysteine methyltransferase, partial [Gammaproteobacteria bacterium]|nr:5-methyltetrahydropteroyltriglutamate--homocysteine methyltransferase [Gammaproteobacteria bacterium]